MSGILGPFIALTVFSTMLALGLGLHGQALGSWLQKPQLPMRLILGSCLLMPLMAWLVLRESPWSGLISAPMRFGMALMAICPSAPLALRRNRRAGGDHQLAALVQVGAALVAIMTVPLLGLAFRHSVIDGSWQFHPLDVAMQVGRVQVLPLLLGLGLRHWQPRLADRLEARLGRITAVMLVVMFTLVLLRAGPLLLRFLPDNLPGVLLMVVMVLTSLLIGRLLAGHDQRHQLSGELVTAMRNPGLALLFANEHAGELPGLRLSILLYVVVTLLVSIPFVQHHRGKENR